MSAIIDPSKIRRHGTTIILHPGLTATERHESGSLPEIRFRKNGKVVGYARGSSVYFSNPLTQEDREYLATLGREYVG